MNIVNKAYKEFLKEVKDNSVDLVIIDPPYLQDSHGGGGAFGSRMREYHKGVDSLGNGFTNDVLDETVRITKKLNAYIFCSKKQLTQILNYFEEKGYMWELLVYIKTNPTPTCNNKYLSDTEYIVYVREKGVKLYGSYHTKKKYFLQPNGKSEWEHPTIKPLNIIKTLIENSTKEGQLVCDFFMGSGTTAIACEQTKRKCIGCEIEKKYCDIWKKRMEIKTLF